MSRATHSIPSTHTGSLPRPDDLIQIMWAVGDGIPVDAKALDQRVCSAIDEVVRKQVEAGVTIINDGEMSKPSYATYVKDRLSGFTGESVQLYFFEDLVDFPRSAEAVAGNPGRRKRSAPACTSPIEVIDKSAAVKDMTELRRAATANKHEQIFTSAASPGVVSLFFGNEYYKTREEYVFAIAEAMRFEYEAIAAAGALYLIVSGKSGFETVGGFASNGYDALSPDGYSMMSALVAEVILTAFFLIVILGSTNARAPKGFAPIAIGLALTLIHLISIPITNTSVNPARSTSQALFVGGEALSQLWLFWAAPIAGAIAAGFIYKKLLQDNK